MKGHRIARPLWLSVGCVAVASGAAGVVLPLVPTTPFLLLAAFAFARSSPRLDAWLRSHAHFGPPIENWRRHRSIDRRTKRLAIAVIIATHALTWLVGAPAWVLALQAAVLVAVAAFILTRPDGPATEREPR